jgi:hypothetical protein
MKNTRKKSFSVIIAVFLLISVMFTGCTSDSVVSTTPGLNLNITGLEDLGANAIYEGWIIVNGVPISTGTFTVDASGNLSITSFNVNATDLAAATAFVLTIEPVPDTSSAPSETHLLAGDFSGNSAPLTVGHSAALGNDFSTTVGKYILATPTNGNGTNELSGIWFLDLVPPPAIGLILPTLPAGWKYEGWAVINGSPVTTGTFLKADTVDESAPYSGTLPGPPFPGEDFLMNAPAGQTFPTNLAGMVAVISIEPFPDNSISPFTLKPLLKAIPPNAIDHTTYDLDQNLGSFPTGTATR